MKYLFGSLLLVMSSFTLADLKYCEGTVSEIVTRDSSEATYVKLNTNTGETSWARIGGSDGYNDYQEVQISMLLSAYVAQLNVQLELKTDGYEFNSCQDFEIKLPVRFVRFR